jgi:NADP-dependent 3-hydroxy acid dehydrogenase YdfG
MTKQNVEFLTGCSSGIGRALSEELHLSLHQLN